MSRSSQNGFTLVELSIVLVIIGLIVGGILVGKDMIAAAELRATIAQIDKYKSAVGAFRIKYNALPGDMLPRDASAFGFYSMTPGGRATGDNNGMIESQNSMFCPTYDMFSNETAIFWRHLGEAGLIDGQFGVIGPSQIVDFGGLDWYGAQGIVTNVSQSIPPAKLGGNVYFSVISGAGTNYFTLWPVIAINLDSDHVTQWDAHYLGPDSGVGSGIRAAAAYNIDVKIDDGRPETGAVLALGYGADGTIVTCAQPGSPANLIGGITPSAAATSTSNKCVIGTGTASTDTYNTVSSTGGNDMSCALAVRF
jgi:prepilin-type N-terminal cleavage/methylation domain-containing protein